MPSTQTKPGQLREAKKLRHRDNGAQLVVPRTLNHIKAPLAVVAGGESGCKHFPSDNCNHVSGTCQTLPMLREIQERFVGWCMARSILMAVLLDSITDKM